MRTDAVIEGNVRMSGGGDTTKGNFWGTSLKDSHVELLPLNKVLLLASVACQFFFLARKWESDIKLLNIADVVTV